MITYKIDIDRVGRLTLAMFGSSPEEFCNFAHKASQLKIPLVMSQVSGATKIMQGSFSDQQKILNLLNEIGAKEHQTGVFELPNSVRQNHDINIMVISFDFGDIHLKTSKFSAIFYRLISNIFKNQLYISGENDYIISSPTHNLFSQFIDQLKRSSFITTSIEPLLTKLPKDVAPISNPIIIAEESDKKNWLFKIFVNSGSTSPAKTKENFSKIIEFIFPNNATSIDSINLEEEVIEVNTGVKNVYYFRCSYKDAKYLQLILEKNDFNTLTLNKVIEKLLSQGRMSKTRIDGEIDGFKDEKEFKQEVVKYEDLFFADSSLPKEKRHFFPAQVDGIKFLYSRQNALLGDEVGVGKTIQTIIAADLRLKKSGGNCLIITKNAVAPQLAIEIQKILRISPSEISDDWSVLRKWNVLSYQLFEEDSPITKDDPTPIRELITNILLNRAKSGSFTVCILDEIHMIKNGNPENRNKNGFLKHGANHRTFNIQEITKFIPFVWGASATIVANKPIDLYNQLRAINHNAGLMNYDKFKEKYSGSSTDPVDQFRKADEIRDLLTDQGVYVRRSKKEVNPEIPPIKIEETNFNFTEDEIDEIMRKAKNKDRPTAQEMSVIREKIAFAKIDNTINLAENLLSSGKKVGIFTAHSKSLQEIKRRLELSMALIFPGENKKVAAIYGGQDRKARQIEIQNFKNTASEYMAIVISIDAGGTGIDFPNILTDVIVNDFDWSPSDDDQSLGRFYRINSLNPINVTYMIAENTLDRRFYQLLKQKKEIAERIQILSDSEKTIATLTGPEANKRLAEIREKKWAAQMEMSTIDLAYKASGSTV